MMVGEVTESEVWKRIWEEGWKMWKEGLDKLQKTESGMESARAKQQMEDAVRFLKMPIRLGDKKDEARKAYGSRLERTQEVELKRVFDESVKGENNG